MSACACWVEERARAVRSSGFVEMDTANGHLINFSLTDLDSVVPWGEGHNRLHWFGLTEGSYWMRVGQAKLFEFVAGSRPSESSEGTYVDYYIARLWEDLLDLLPRVLHEVPQSIEHSLRNRSSWQRGKSRGAAGAFWAARALDCGYLVNPPHIWIWSSAGVTKIRWSSNSPEPDGPRWTAGEGEWEMPTAGFVEEVKGFDHRLIAEMGDRVTAVLAGALGPAIEIDVEQLNREHHDRATWLSKALSADPAGSDALAGSPRWELLESD
jgi:hypothetical protein